MATLSVCMIVKNEQEFLASCLNSVKDIANEIVIVDTGSTDDTLAIAKRFGAKIYSVTWSADFSAARNFSLSKATKDWILVIDADEILEPSDALGIQRLVSLPNFDAFTVEQRTYTNQETSVDFIPTPLSNNGYSGYFLAEVVRLFRNKSGYHFSGKVHEVLDSSLVSLNARIGNSDVILHHFEADKGLDAIAKKQIAYFSYAKEELKTNPKNYKLLCDSALICFLHLRDFETAKEYLSRAQKLEPKTPRAFILAGQLGVAMNELSFAIAANEHLLLLGKENHPVALFNLGEIYFAKTDFNKSKEFYEKALAAGSRRAVRIAERLREIQNK